MRCLIVGPARCGTTALATLVAQAMGQPRLMIEEPVPQVLAELRALDDDMVAKFVLGNDPVPSVLAAAPAFDRRIVLVRDLRDNLVSCLLYGISSRPEQLGDAAFLDRFVGLLRRKQADPVSVDWCELAQLLNTEQYSFVVRTIQAMENCVRFIAKAGSDWFVLHYEDLVEGNLRALSRYLGVQLPNRPVSVPAAYARVARSKAVGDWRHWFTARDVAALRPAADPIMRQLGYYDDWVTDVRPRIAEETSWLYVLGLIEERQRHFGLPLCLPAVHAAEVPGRPVPACNICGGTVFGPGPNGRMATNGTAPACRSCGSLERQRIVRRLLQALPAGFLAWRQGLQFSPDPGPNASAFRSYEVSVYDGENSLDIQDIARESGSYDFVCFSHVLEFVPDDLRGFAELVRLLSPKGLLLACFSAPLLRRESVDFREPPYGPHAARHLYGADLAQRFQCAEKGLAMMVVEETDCGTNTREVVHLFLKDSEDVPRIRTWLHAFSRSARLLSVHED